MAANEYEPSAESVEALDKEICGIFALTATGSRWKAIAKHLLRRQHEREAGLLAVLNSAQPSIGKQYMLLNVDEWKAALAAHAKLDAPKVPTLTNMLSCAEVALINNCPDDALRYVRNALMAAVEREEKR